MAFLPTTDLTLAAAGFGLDFGQCFQLLDPGNATCYKASHRLTTSLEIHTHFRS